VQQTGSMEVKADAQLGARQGGVAEPAKGACEVARKSGDSRLEKRTTLLTNTEVKDLNAEDRLRVRQDKSLPLVQTLHEWLMLNRQKVPEGSATATAID
jgi:hypothetical protein